MHLSTKIDAESFFVRQWEPTKMVDILSEEGLHTVEWDHPVGIGFLSLDSQRSEIIWYFFLSD